MPFLLHLHSELIALAIHHGDLSRLDPMKDLETIIAQIRWQAARMELIAQALEDDYVAAQKASIVGKDR